MKYLDRFTKKRRIRTSHLIFAAITLLTMKSWALLGWSKTDFDWACGTPVVEKDYNGVHFQLHLVHSQGSRLGLGTTNIHPRTDEDVRCYKHLAVAEKNNAYGYRSSGSPLYLQPNALALSTDNLTILVAGLINHKVVVIFRVGGESTPVFDFHPEAPDSLVLPPSLFWSKADLESAMRFMTSGINAELADRDPSKKIYGEGQFGLFPHSTQLLKIEQKALNSGEQKASLALGSAFHTYLQETLKTGMFISQWQWRRIVIPEYEKDIPPEELLLEKVMITQEVGYANSGIRNNESDQFYHIGLLNAWPSKGPILATGSTRIDGADVYILSQTNGADKDFPLRELSLFSATEPVRFLDELRKELVTSETDSKAGGLGLVFKMEKGFPAIKKLIPRGAAATTILGRDSGLEHGLIVAIKSTPESEWVNTEFMNPCVFLQKVRGKPGTPVELRIAKSINSDVASEVTIIREVIPWIDRTTNQKALVLPERTRISGLSIADESNNTFTQASKDVGMNSDEKILAFQSNNSCQIVLSDKACYFRGSAARVLSRDHGGISREIAELGLNLSTLPTGDPLIQSSSKPDQRSFRVRIPLASIYDDSFGPYIVSREGKETIEIYAINAKDSFSNIRQNLPEIFTAAHLDAVADAKKQKDIKPLGGWSGVSWGSTFEDTKASLGSKAQSSGPLVGSNPEQIILHSQGKLGHESFLFFNNKLWQAQLHPEESDQRAQGKYLQALIAKYGIGHVEASTAPEDNDCPCFNVKWSNDVGQVIFRLRYEAQGSNQDVIEGAAKILGSKSLPATIKEEDINSFTDFVRKSSLSWGFELFYSSITLEKEVLEARNSENSTFKKQKSKLDDL